MQAEYKHFSDAVKQVKNIPGDFIELGVYKGTTFIPLAQAAHLAKRHCYGVDSFVGFSAAHPVHDRTPDGQIHYDIGMFDAGGENMVMKLNVDLGEASKSVTIVPGFIPSVLDRLPQDKKFAFAHVDLDQYVPTMDALMWLWPRMSPGGVIALHDWFPQYNCLASLAIKNFCKDHNLTIPKESKVSYAFLTR